MAMTALMARMRMAMQVLRSPQMASKAGKPTLQAHTRSSMHMIYTVMNPRARPASKHCLHDSCVLITSFVVTAPFEIAYTTSLPVRGVRRVPHTSCGFIGAHMLELIISLHLCTELTPWGCSAVGRACSCEMHAPGRALHGMVCHTGRTLGGQAG